jgi:hypothetical protein
MVQSKTETMLHRDMRKGDTSDAGKWRSPRRNAYVKDVLENFLISLVGTCRTADRILRV